MQDVQDCLAPPDQLPGKPPSDHVGQIKVRLAWARQTATAHLLAAQEKQKQQFNRQTLPCSFQEGEHVLVHSLLFPRQATSEWEGPFTIMRVLGPVNYKA